VGAPRAEGCLETSRTRSSSSSTTASEPSYLRMRFEAPGAL
jgi:hypothetical protein